MTPKTLYLCAPYSSTDKSIILERVHLVNQKAAADNTFRDC